MTSQAVKRFVLPLIIFPALTALTIKLMLGPLAPSGLAAKLRPQCAGPNASPYALSYTGQSNVDARLCGLIAFFHNTMADPAGLKFITYFMGTGSVITLFPSLEASRSRKNLLLAFPLLWLLLGQVVTVAIAINLFNLIFILTGSHLKRSKEDTKITRSHAESLIFGVIAGLVIPSIGMLLLQDPQVTALWQIYPVCISVASGVHLLARRPTQFNSSGWIGVQTLLLGSFIFSSSLHFATVWPVLGDIPAFKTLFMPSLVPLPPSTPIGIQTLDFLKWDAVFAFTSLAVTTLWFARGLVQFLALISWYIFVIPIAGPGAAIAAVLLWREGGLQ